MQGPFSKEMNRAMIEQLNCKYLVTKMSGATGGYQEKLDAALETGCTPIVVGRPLVEEGISLAACRRMLCKKFPASVPGNFSCGNRCRQRKTHDTGGTAGAEGGGLTSAPDVW